jgi:hypothetical protein
MIRNILLAFPVACLLEAREVRAGTLVEYDMVDEAVIARITACTCAGIGEPRVGVREISIVDMGPDAVVRERGS